VASVPRHETAESSKPMMTDSQGEQPEQSGLGTSRPPSGDGPAHPPAPNRGKVGSWQTRRVLLVVALGIALLAGTGFGYQTIASEVDASRYPAPGKLVDVGGYRLHLDCTGVARPGRPTVILEAAWGGTSLDWSKVQPGVAAVTRVCAYDRAGYGWSDTGRKPRTAGQVVTELHTLLTRAGVADPYVLAGHSLGGLLVRLYAYRYPRQVAGLVLVDSPHEQGDFQWTWTGSALTTICAALARVGIVRLLVSRVGDIAHYPPTAQPAVKAHFSQTRFCRTYADEGAALEQSAAQVRAGRHPLGRLPLVVLTRGVDGKFYQGNAGKPAPSSWLTQQRDLVGLSTNSTQIMATRSGHYILLDQPELVIAAINQVLTGAV